MASPQQRLGAALQALLANGDVWVLEALDEIASPKEDAQLRAHFQAKYERSRPEWSTPITALLAVNWDSRRRGALEREIVRHVVAACGQQHEHAAEDVLAFVNKCVCSLGYRQIQKAVREQFPNDPHADEEVEQVWHTFEDVAHRDGLAFLREVLPMRGRIARAHEAIVEVV